MELIGYIAALLIGLTLGLLGGGGSILTIPILVYLFKLDAVTATAYSLFIVGVTSLVGVIPKYKLHMVNLKTGMLFGLPSMVSIFLTRKWIIPILPETLFTIGEFSVTRRIFLLGLFAILMIITSYSMIRNKKPQRQREGRWQIFLLVFEGVLIGFLTGLVGAGGGFLIVPALIMLTGLPVKTATGTSLLIIGVNSIFGFTGDLFNLDINWVFLTSLTAIAVVGIFIGNKLTNYYRGSQLKRAFGWMTLIMGIWILYAELLK